MTHPTRRRILTVGAAGLAGVGITHHAQASAQNSPAPVTQMHPNGSANKVVLIAGATLGIGEATARAFAKEGAIVHSCVRGN